MAINIQQLWDKLEISLRDFLQRTGRAGSNYYLTEALYMNQSLFPLMNPTEIGEFRKVLHEENIISEDLSLNLSNSNKRNIWQCLPDQYQQILVQLIEEDIKLLDRDVQKDDRKERLKTLAQQLVVE